MFPGEKKIGEMLEKQVGFFSTGLIRAFNKVIFIVWAIFSSNYFPMKLFLSESISEG